MKITKAVIPAAGFGTRVLPATKNFPKEMFPIVDKPTIQYIVEEAVQAVAITAAAVMEALVPAITAVQVIMEVPAAETAAQP